MALTINAEISIGMPLTPGKERVEIWDGRSPYEDFAHPIIINHYFWGIGTMASVVATSLG